MQKFSSKIYCVNRERVGALFLLPALGAEICAKLAVISVIVELKQKGVRAPRIPNGCWTTPAPLVDFIRSSSSPRRDLILADNDVRGTQISMDRKRERYEELVCWEHELSDDRVGIACIV
jgi:hypothetical protein